MQRKKTQWKLTNNIHLYNSKDAVTLHKNMFDNDKHVWFTNPDRGIILYVGDMTL